MWFESGQTYDYRGYCEITTTVKDIDKFKNNIYKEKRLYLEKTGLIEFSVTVPKKAAYACEGEKLQYKLSRIFYNKQK
ncbi:hypothetical protein ACER0A_011365 [Haloimpatiens sp. FM7315]|uniref:hypothetical protein n=1 Tax=Haloimpatiens sp. FM7315 TaxID=3298609 RepID=UPI0035A2AA4B